MSTRGQVIEDSIEAAYNATPVQMRDKALEFIERFCMVNKEFNGADILKAWRATNEPFSKLNWRDRWGGIISAAKKKGLIEKIGESKPTALHSHMSKLSHWRSKIYKDKK